MATKLYPPQLEGSLPAFFKDYDEGGTLTGVSINIPFGINRSTNVRSISSIILKLRTTSANTTYIISGAKASSFDTELGTATFRFDYDAEDKNSDQTASLINEGQYYRAQIAFVSSDTRGNETIGYYSTVGIIKCVAKPSVSIQNMDPSIINKLTNSFTGVYKQNTSFGDSTEKAYSYIFNLYDNYGTIIDSTGEIIHDISADTVADESTDEWKLNKDLSFGELYTLKYQVTTLNGLVITSSEYKMMKASSVRARAKIYPQAEMDTEEGYIKIKLKGEDGDKYTTKVYKRVTDVNSYDPDIQYFYKENEEDEEYLEYTYNSDWDSKIYRGQIYTATISATVFGEKTYTGNFILSRATNKDDYITWTEIGRFTMFDDFPSSFTFQDWVIEQGVKYRYSLQQYNIHNVISERAYYIDLSLYHQNPEFIYDVNYSIDISADFEHMYLSDGERQLKIKFNPKMSSFKSTIPEQKVETIGSKYPFIFRNGQVCYKEFPISGLISYQMDSAKLFLTMEEREAAGVLEDDYYRIRSNKDDYYIKHGHESTYNYVLRRENIFDPITHRIIGTKTYYVLEKKKNIKSYVTNLTDSLYYDHSEPGQNIYDIGNLTDENEITKLLDKRPIRTDTNITSDNISSERYFKLKVLDWLNDGKIKLFRSPTEGNYLVRLLNVQLSPVDALGRMLHSFTCTAYEMDEINSTTLSTFQITKDTTHTLYESQWGGIDVNALLKGEHSYYNTKDAIDGYIRITPENTNFINIYLQDFVPGDKIRIYYSEGNSDNNSIDLTIGLTGTLDFNKDERKILSIGLRPNSDIYNYDDFYRTLNYETSKLLLTEFDAIADTNMNTTTAEQFVGPKENLLKSFNLRTAVYGNGDVNDDVGDPLPEEEGYENIYNDLVAHQRFSYNINNEIEKFVGTQVDILHVQKRELIPVYACQYPVNEATKYTATPFGIGYVDNKNIKDFITSQQTLKTTTNEEIDRINWSDGLNINDLYLMLEYEGLTYNNLDIYEIYVYKEDYKLITEGNYRPESKYYIKDNNEYIRYLRPNDMQFDNFLEDWHNKVRKFEMYELKEDWFLNDDISKFRYYDLYTNNWFEEGTNYDASFSINKQESFVEEEANIIHNSIYYGDNNINLEEMNEITLYNLGEIDQIRLGNGVVAEVSIQIKTIDYDVEESIIAVKAAKEAYLTAKDNIEASIDIAMDHAVELQEAIVEKEQLVGQDGNSGKIAAVQRQIDSFESNAQESIKVKDIAEEQLKVQKQILFNTFKEQIYELTDILKKEEMYLSLADAQQVTLLDTSNYNNDSFDSLTPYINTTLAGDFKTNAEEEQLGQVNENNRKIYYFEWPTGMETATLPSTGEINIYDIINDIQIYYDQLFENQIAQYEKNISECDSEIASCLVQRGELIGGYITEFNDENPPKEDTLVYTEYYLNKIYEQYDFIYEQMVEVKSELTDKLLTYIINNSINTDNDLIKITDNFIVNNADKLLILLQSLKITREHDLTNLQTLYNAQGLDSVQKERSYDPILNSIESEINKIDTQITTLQKIKNDFKITNNKVDYNYKRKFADEIHDLNVTNANNYNQFDEDVEVLQNNYLNTVTNIVNSNTLMIEHQYTINDIISYNKDLTADEELNLILDLLVDSYTRGDATTVKSYLKKYHNREKENVDINTIIKKLLNDEAVYQAKLTKLQEGDKEDTSLPNYLQLGEKGLIEKKEAIEAELEEFKAQEEAARKERAEYLIKLEEAKNNLLDSEALINIKESNELIEKIASDEINQANQFNLYEYMKWIKAHNENLIAQIQQTYQGVTSRHQYALTLLEYINAYEVEAFQFLHNYIALEADLHNGYNDQLDVGVDEFYDKLNLYWLTVYKDILPLALPELTQEQQNALINDDQRTRMNMYEELKNNLKNKLLYNDEESETLRLGILIHNPNTTSPTYKLVRLENNPNDSFYPLIYDFAGNSYVETTGEYALLEDNINNVANSKQLRAVTPDENGQYLKANIDPRSHNKFYTYNSTPDNLTLAFTDEEDFQNNYEARASISAQNGRPLLWLTRYPEVNVILQKHTNLYDTFEAPIEFCESNSESIENNFLIEPNFFDFYKYCIGLIIHDDYNGNERNSYISLIENEITILSSINSYFVSWVQYYKAQKENTQAQTLQDYEEILSNAYAQKAQQQSTLDSCNVLLDSYDISDGSESSEVRSLKIMIKNAEAQIRYYSLIIEDYEQKKEELLNNDAGLYNVSVYSKQIPDNLKLLNNNINEFNGNYKYYKMKVEHYLNLLFNRNPYGVTLESSILVNKNLDKVGNIHNKMYNLGIAYALENYKQNIIIEEGSEEDSLIYFNDINETVQTLVNKFEVNYDLMFRATPNDPAPRQVTDGRKYYRRDKEDRTYSEYTLYNNNYWADNVQKYEIYYTYYPALCELAGNFEYEKATEYNSNTEYYYYNEKAIVEYDIINNYYITTHQVSAYTYWGKINAEQFAQYKKYLFTKENNGGLMAFVKALKYYDKDTKEYSNYMFNIVQTYKDLLSLYYDILSLEAGDETRLTNLQNQLAAYQLRLAELEEILQYKDIVNLDVKTLINTVYQTEAEYLRLLTIAYTENIEKLYVN